MIYYCSNCWNEISKEAKVCPHCGTNQTALEQESFIQKLIRALKHPEPSTPVRAAEILGELKAKEALHYLIDLTKTSTDPFIIKAALSSIKKIEDKNYIVKTKQSISKNDINNLQ